MPKGYNKANKNVKFIYNKNVYGKRRQGKWNLPRKARSRGKVYYYKIFMTYCFKYVHASREMVVHLTRCA